jgi:diaminopimelate decarboxylase
MNHFERRDGELYCEDVPLAQIATEVGTPTYVYSKATITRHQKVWLEAWGDVDHRMCFAVKACSNLAILNLLAKGGAGFDIVSGGELARALKAGASPESIVFSGVGKTETELRYALEVGIGCFNVESLAELHMLEAVAASLHKRAPISLRVNPDVDPKTHPYISTGLRRAKFGIPWDEAVAVYDLAKTLPHLDIRGVDCHIGSQLESSAPFVEALDRLLDLVETLAKRGIDIHHVDIGGGLGITYRDEAPPSPSEYVAAVRARLAARGMSHLRILTEPGRVIVGNAGVLLSRVTLKKTNGDARFVVVDAGMNDLIRPALYEAWHDIVPVAAPRSETEVVDVVGPVCETGDFFAQERPLPHLEAGELIAVRTAGAYGMVMASNYNTRPRPAEVLVDGANFHVIRARETFEDLVRGEFIPT